MTVTEIPKVRRDGKVAVLVSPGFGAGWSTWAHDDDQRLRAVFAPDVVAWVEAGKPESETYKFETYGYTGGLGDVEIVWLDEGDRFEIHEYDGQETLTVLGPDWGYTA